MPANPPSSLPEGSCDDILEIGATVSAAIRSRHTFLSCTWLW
jgi:hypothetical protein